MQPEFALAAVAVVAGDLVGALGLFLRSMTLSFTYMFFLFLGLNKDKMTR